MTHTKLIFTFLFFIFLSTNVYAQVTQEWIARYNSPSKYGDYSKTVVVDGQGNVYVAGNSAGVTDFVTIKYNSNGDTVWVRRYNGPFWFRDGSATCIAIDSSGNVYVTGFSRDVGYQKDYTTIKYNSAGIQQWVQRYNGPGNSDDEAYSLALDVQGNVYITGRSVGSGTSNDYATIKYNTSGLVQWVQRYNGSGNGNDQAYSLSVDNSGNVFITGRSMGNGTDYDYTTIKYNAMGVEQWVQRYNGPGNNIDGANSIAVDGSGNSYVTGSSEGNGTSSDYATIKYNTTGVEQWIQRYNGSGNDSESANSIAVDDLGNVYITGSSVGSETSNDYTTIKYNTTGIQQWIQRYNGPGNDQDLANSILVDDLGNSYITGFSVGIGTYNDYATIMYNASGVLQWVSRFNGTVNGKDDANSIAVDESGNVYVTGNSMAYQTGSDFATVKYNSSGIQQWISKYNKFGNLNDYSRSLTVDHFGNVYVTGTSYGGQYFDEEYDMATVKYDSGGDSLWVRRYDGLDYDVANSIAMDDFGNVFVTGASDDGGLWDFATVKYNTNGDLLWIRLYNGPSDISDQANSLAIDNSGNVYVTGYSNTWYGLNIYSDYATVKYNTNGNLQWVKRYSGPGNGNENPSSIAVDSSGNVYVTGSSDGSSTDYATLKYNTSGGQQWLRRYNGLGNGLDNAHSIAVDDFGYVYVTGSSIGIGSGSDYATIKYNSAGDSLWVSRYNGSGNGSDGANSLVVDGSGNVYVTGSSTGIGTSTDYVTIKYNPNGDTLWVRRYNGPGNSTDGAKLITLDKYCNVYVAGSSTGNGTGSDIAVLKYNTLGDEIWIQRYNGPGNSSDGASSISVDDSGYVYVTGISVGTVTDNDYVTIKYSQSPPPIPNAPVLVSPANGALLVETNPLLDWDNSAYAESYQVQVSTDSLFTSTAYDSSSILSSEFQIPNNGLNINTTYYWRVNATNVTGTSPWSTVFHFMTGATNITHNNEIPKEIRLYNSYPNPFNPLTKIKFDIPTSSYVKLIVYDVLGREITTLINEKLNAGRYEMDWDGNSYPSGVYFYRLVTEDFVDVKKMMLIK